MKVECCLPNTHHILVLGGRHLRFPAEGEPTKSRQEMTKTVCPLLIYGQWQNGSPVSSTWERLKWNEEEMLASLPDSDLPHWIHTHLCSPHDGERVAGWKCESGVIDSPCAAHSTQKFKISDWSFNTESFQITNKEQKVLPGRKSRWTLF